MRFVKSICAAALLVSLVMGTNQAASAADSCETQAKALSPNVEAVSDADTKSKAGKLLEKAIEEATVEGDEDECLDYLKDLKEVLGIQ